MLNVGGALGFHSAFTPALACDESVISPSTFGFALPEGSYRFRVDVDGTQFWSGAQNHCEIGKCGQVTLTIPQPVLVSVQDSAGTPQAGLKVYAFDGSTYTNFTGTTDLNGQVAKPALG